MLPYCLSDCATHLTEVPWFPWKLFVVFEESEEDRGKSEFKGERIRVGVPGIRELISDEAIRVWLPSALTLTIGTLCYRSYGGGLERNARAFLRGQISALRVMCVLVTKAF